MFKHDLKFTIQPTRILSIRSGVSIDNTGSRRSSSICLLDLLFFFLFFPYSRLLLFLPFFLNSRYSFFHCLSISPIEYVLFSFSHLLVASYLFLICCSLFFSFNYFMENNFWQVNFRQVYVCTLLKILRLLLFYFNLFIILHILYFYFLSCFLYF